jgi:hypothetical protein
VATRKIANTVADPTLPKTPIEIDGKTYFLCFDLGALAEAESYFDAQGHNVNLLMALPRINLANARIVFPCALHKFHPEIEFGDAQKLLNFQNTWIVAGAIRDAWEAAVPEAKTPEAEAKAEANPHNP